jgi:hypothetical protein
MKYSISGFTPFTGGMLTVALWLSVSAPLQAQICCPETNGVKWVQRPDVGNGIDYNTTQPFTLADDFKCTNSGPITDIHLWGSWLSDHVDFGATYTLAIWSDGVTNVDRPYSHPGNLVWSQVFAPGNYTVCPYTNVTEPFNNPDGTPQGGSSNLYYLCFFPDPANVFRQAGSPNAPTNYWLSVTVSSALPAPAYFGWKSSPDHYSDTAVWTTVAFPPPTGAWNPLYNPVTSTNHVDLAFKITTAVTNTQPVCVENGVKYVQWPNLFGGLDVWNNGPWVLADDFVCTTTGPISDIHLWGSWNTNNVATNSLTFWLAIYDDVPLSATNIFSRPGGLLWQEKFVPGQYIETPWASSQENFLDPGPPINIGSDTEAWYYCFYPTNTFPQQGTAAAPKIYWLMVYAQSPTGNTFQYGWKTTTNVQNDISVHAPWPGSPPPTNPGWQRTFQASTGGPLDLAFKITTVAPPPVVCVESDFDKYVQSPNIFGGFDVWDTPYVLADDFVCTNTGPLSDIHLWGSWLNDSAHTNSILFWLGIYDDVPANPPNIPNSHPGTNLLWQQWFNPGQYAESIWTNNAQEQFLDPGQSNVLGGDSVVWYYCFYPTNAFQQTGTTNNAKTYWLAAYAQLPVGANYNFGWKTSTGVLKDTSVHAVWPGSPPIANPGWTPTGFQPPAGGPPVPLDLAFKLTMCGPLMIHWLPPTNVVVTWPGLGHLQSATNVSGPYVDIPGSPISPFTDYSVNPTNKFYRLRCY